MSSTEYLFKVIDRLLSNTSDPLSFSKIYKMIYDEVEKTRPVNTASINLLREVGRYILENGFNGISEFLDTLRRRYEDACSEAARIAANRVVDDDVLMTMSNGVCLRRMFKFLVDEGIRFSVYVLESRPGMEGLDLASYLDRLGVKTYLIIDSAARFFMKNVKKVIIGAEAIAVNGAVIGKVGTSLLCLVANESRVRVFVIAPLYKFSYETLHGELLELPEGDWSYLMDEEIRSGLPENYRARVPLYDVTPPHLIDGLATEYGLFAPQAIPAIIRQVYGEFPVRTEDLEIIVNRVIEVLSR